MSRRVALSGASGFIGSALTDSLEHDGIEVVPLVRDSPGTGGIWWNPEADRIDQAALEGFDAVVHLAGESLLGLWTAEKKRKIMESRARGTRLLATTLQQLERPPRTFISASAVGYYGDGGDSVLEEGHPPGTDFLARVCVAWEEEAIPAAEAGIRVVHPRFGLVLDRSGGALQAMLPAFRLGLGARLGNGQQWMSWIALNDAVRVLRFALERDGLVGPLNAVAPEPVRNEAFTRSLARALGRPALFAIPSFMLRHLTFGMGEALLLASQRAVPVALTDAGFVFEASTIDHALAAERASVGKE